MVNQNVQDALKKFQDTKNKEHVMTKKQIKELREDFNEHQSETKDTIKRKIHELKRTTQIIKEDMNKDMENLRRNNQTEILEIKSPYSQTENTGEGQSSRLDKWKTESQSTKINKIEIKEKKTEEIFIKQLKSCERNMQEFSNSIKTPNLRIMSIEEGEEVQAKGICNMFNKIITENFPNLKKVLPIQV
jgi:hypothetical protein